MEDQDRETRIDEDVEGHGHHPAPASHKSREDDGDDVEGHGHHPAANAHKSREDDGDDVEGHMFKQAHKASHKA
jgi:hypothetical protein